MEQAAFGSSGVAPVHHPKAAVRRNGVVRGCLATYSAAVEDRRQPMKTANRLAVLAFAVALNVAALAALHIAMVDGAQQALAANQEFEHVVVSASRTSPALATSNCPTTPNAL
jgi:hypothetical protein